MGSRLTEIANNCKSFRNQPSSRRQSLTFVEIYTFVSKLNKIHDHHNFEMHLISHASTLFKKKLSSEREKFH